jgi:PHS family inorganic phosphate transporter-like MFS transporter
MAEENRAALIEPSLPSMNMSPPKMNTVMRLLVVSVGFLTDAYDLFVIGIVMVIIRSQFGENVTAESILATSVLVGATCGQIFFGIMGDRIGRKKMFVITLAVITSMAFLSAFAFPSNIYIYIYLGIVRAILGFGIGGEYPLSATLAAEGATDPNTRGRHMALVFSMQGIGYLLAPLVVLFFFTLGLPKEYVWRLTLGFGAIPGILTAYHRIRLHESQQFETTHKRQISNKVLFMIFQDFKWTLLGTTSTWFLFDITFYGNGLFKETVLILLGFSGSGTLDSQLWNTAISSLIIATISIPGYWVSLLCIDCWGRRPIQFLGFVAMAIIFLIMGIFLDFLKSSTILFVGLYALSFFFSNFGPNTTTYIIPGEAFPTEIRSTCHGISSAAGKLGAIVGTSAFASFSKFYGYKVTFLVCSFVALLGFAMTFLIPETKRQKLITRTETEDQGFITKR